MLRPSLALFCALAAVLPADAGAGAPAQDSRFRDHVAGLVETGSLDFEQALLIRFQRIFAPAELPIEFASDGAWPERSATLLIHDYRHLRDGLSSATTQAIDAYLAHSATRSSAFLETPHFRLTYELTGTHAVSPSDVAPANGVPDFVERVGEYLEFSRSRLVDDAGFTAPVPGDDGRYPVTFRSMASFGYTYESGSLTGIVLHCNYTGFPANQDPDGSVLGAAKVTAAHELKHASQFAASGWTEGGWLEADATWAEDFVFDETNDYLRYLDYGSPVSAPENWLAGGQASYEDCLWQHLLTERFGSDVLVEFFERRAVHPTEPVATSFEAVLGPRGWGVADARAELGRWAYFSGANSWQRPVGFQEAASFPTPPLGAHVTTAGETASGNLAGSGSRYVRVGVAGRSGTPWIQFLGTRDAPYSISVVTLDDAAVPTIENLTMVGGFTSSHELAREWESIASLVLLVTNVGDPTTAGDFFVTIDDRNAVGVDALAGDGFDLLPNRPNPFRGATTIAFSVPAAGRVRLAIYDVGGRMVRRLVEGDRLAAGVHERAWDGLDEGGRLAAPGVYYYRLETAELGATRKMLLLR